MVKRMSGAPRGGNLSRAQWMLRRLDEEGLRLTGPRELVVQAIADKPGSFTPEALVDELRPHGIGRATVYRALELLERLGGLRGGPLAGVPRVPRVVQGPH